MATTRPTPRLTRAEQQAQTRARILDAAREEFIERGYLAASVEDIAARAGYTRGAVYGNFASKEAVFVALYQQAALQEQLRMGAFTTRARDPQARVNAFASYLAQELRRLQPMMRAHLEFMIATPNTVALTDQLEAMSSDGMSTLNDRIVAELEALGTTTSLSTEAISSLLHRFLNGLLLDLMNDPGLDPTSTVTDLLRLVTGI